LDTIESERVFSFVIASEERLQRLDIFLASQIRDLTRSRAQDLIRNGFAEVNGGPSKASYRIRSGDRITLTMPPVRPSHLEPEPVEFALIYEDPCLIVLNKPAGLVSHPAPGHPTGTLVHGLLQYCQDLSGIGGILRPGIVHRLDKDTSGLMVVAKTDRIHAALSAQFKSGMVKKRYLALVHGIIQTKAGKIDLPIARHPWRRKEMAVVRSGGRMAVTLWEREEEIGDQFTLLAVTPKTGRTHQIRVHLSHVGHPIVGDPVYGHRKHWWKKHLPNGVDALPRIERQMLHAERLGFVHPDTQDYREFQAPLPGDMKSVIETLRRIDLKDKKP
jgi:23S rRNA pseudouridine1911/1915/1917 synthase